MNFKQMGSKKTAKEQVKSLDKKHTKNTKQNWEMGL